MRNLKKFLALVLAMMMAFSLMVTANAAVTKNATDDSNVYTDGDTVLDEFQVAVDVLTGMGVFHGNSGEFNAKAGITRAEAAAVLYRLVTGDINDRQAQLYAPLATQRFTDVKEGAWYAGYVGFAVDAGLVNGYNGRFMPANNVTGYEMLKMLLKAVGYGKNGEFTGALWQVNVGSTAQSAGVSANSRSILTNINKTHYKNTLSQASAREVVAEMAFQVALNVPMVEYQYGWYNPYVGVPTASIGANDLNPSLGAKVFGLTHKVTGVVIGNQDTGEKYTVAGYADSAAVPAYSEYAWADGTTVPFSANESYVLTTGVEMFGRRLDVYYSSNNTNRDGAFTDVYAYYDISTEHLVVSAADADLDSSANNGLKKVAAAAGFKLVDTDGDNKVDAVFNDFFGRGGSVPDAADTNYGDGARSIKMVDTGGNNITSPIDKYLLISNNSAGVNSLDMVIALSVESSQITESNAVRGIETVAVPVNNGDTSDGGVTGSYIESRSDGAPPYVNDDNVQTVNSVDTGIIAKAALVHDSATGLNDYVVGLHINGTNQNNDLTYARAKDNTGHPTMSNVNISTGEANAINPTQAATNSPNFETGYFLLWKATETTGKVIHFNNDDTVILEVNGQRKTLTKSDWYDTVVCTNSDDVSDTVMPLYALPQSVAFNKGSKVWEESYNNETYTFYLDADGNYLGAKRDYANDFIYGTYLDYQQPLSTSTFTYYLTGIDINGNPRTETVTSYWEWNQTQSARVIKSFTNTSDLEVPYRDSSNNNKLNKDMPYKGFTFTNGVLDENVSADAINVKDYSTNMARLNIYRALAEGTNFESYDATDGLMASKGGDTYSNGLAHDIEINSTVLKIGAVQTETKGVNGANADSDLYLTNNTKIILVTGYGTDSLKPEIYNGISDMMNAYKTENAIINLNLDNNAAWFNGDVDDENAVPYAAMTYFKKSDHTFSQTGLTAEEIGVLIIPKAAVKFTETYGTNSYFMGNPAYTLISAHDSDPVYQYTVYDLEGEEHSIWLNNTPDEVAGDTFLTVKEVKGAKTSDGQQVYRGTFLTTIGTYGSSLAEKNWTSSPSSRLIDGKNADGPAATPVDQTVTYEPINGGIATFTWRNAADADTDGAVVLNVSKAKVKNLNATRPGGGIWPGVKDLDTLNHAGSIFNTTGTPVRVAAACQNGTDVTIIFVCWNQDPAT